MFILMEYSDGSPIVVAGPCWPFCLGVTVPLIVGITGLVSYFLVLNENSGLVCFVLPSQSGEVTCTLTNTPSFGLSFQPSWIAFIYFPCIVLTLLALFCVSCRNPGLMERVTDEEAGEGGWFWNEQVGSFRPPGALYCRECGVSEKDSLVLNMFAKTLSNRVELHCFWNSQVLIQDYVRTCEVGLSTFYYFAS